MKKQKPVETIEDKLHKRLRSYFGGPNVTSPALADLEKDLLAIITTETIKARIDENNEWLKVIEDNDPLFKELFTDRLKDLQKEQKGDKA